MSRSPAAKKILEVADEAMHDLAPTDLHPHLHEDVSSAHREAAKRANAIILAIEDARVHGELTPEMRRALRSARALRGALFCLRTFLYDLDVYVPRTRRAKGAK